MKPKGETPINVLHVAQPTEAGVARVIEALVATQTQRLGWSVSVASPEQGALSSQVRALGCEHTSWTAVRSPSSKLYSEVQQLRQIIDTRNPDVVHLHSSKAGLAGRLAIRGSRPTIFQPHMWSFSTATGVVKPLSRFWESYSQRWTDLLLCVSEEEREEARSRGLKADSVVVENGVDVDKFKPTPRAGARARLGLEDRPTVMCVGRVTHIKGQDRLLDSWARIREQAPTAQLVFVGSGPMLEQLRCRSATLENSDSIRWLGSHDNPVDAYCASTVVVVPSRSEGMALVPIEALSCGREVVSYHVNGVIGSIRDFGAVVPQEDTRRFENEIVKRLRKDSNGPLEEAGRHAHVRARFDQRDMASRVSVLTESVAAGSYHTYSNGG